eukprot:211156-Alexandrium_andersonii.AAC.1
MPDFDVGKHVPPVCVLGPAMIALRLADPEGSLQRTIHIQHHEMKDKAHPAGRSLFRDGNPRIGAFKYRSYPDM